MHKNFNSSKLVRLLEASALQPVDVPRPDSAERLSLLLGVFDAMRLHTTHQSLKATGEAVAPRARAAADSVGVAAQFEQVRAVLVNAIQANPADASNPVDGRSLRLPRGRTPDRLVEAPATVEAPEDTSVDYALYRQRYLDVQRNMELMIGPLRAHVREALCAASPALRQLAALDAVWEQMLGVREQKLLATVPALLKRRFDALRKAHKDDAEDARATWRQPGGWLHVFGKEQQEILLAELDMRLEPVLGLIEAFSKEVKKSA